MDASTILSRLQFAFTISYHYLFPQLPMGLALLLVILKTLYLLRKDECYNTSARFWAKIFSIGFIVGVVTGIPMEFQFGTNWARFSTSAGDIIGQTLAMEGVFAFFLASPFFSNRPSSVSSSLVSRSSDRRCTCSRPACSGPAHGFPAALLSQPTPGCNTLLVTSLLPMADSISPISGLCSSIPGFSRNICTP